MRYNLQLAEAFQKTTIGLDGIIEALGGEPPPNPKTIVWYNDGSISSFNIIGELHQENIPNIKNAIKIDIGNTVTNLRISAFQARSNLTTVLIPKSVKNIGKYSFVMCPAIVTFKERTKAEVQAMTDFRWYIRTNKIICTDGTL